MTDLDLPDGWDTEILRAYATFGIDGYSPDDAVLAGRWSHLIDAMTPEMRSALARKRSRDPFTKRFLPEPDVRGKLSGGIIDRAKGAFDVHKGKALRKRRERQVAAAHLAEDILLRRRGYDEVHRLGLRVADEPALWRDVDVLRARTRTMMEADADPADILRTVEPTFGEIRTHMKEAKAQAEFDKTPEGMKRAAMIRRTNMQLMENEAMNQGRNLRNPLNDGLVPEADKHADIKDLNDLARIRDAHSRGEIPTEEYYDLLEEWYDDWMAAHSKSKQNGIRRRL